jgi:hypothetical protein
LFLALLADTPSDSSGHQAGQVPANHEGAPR